MSPKARRVVRSVKYFFVFIILGCLALAIVTLITPGAHIADLFKPFDQGGMLKEGAWWQMLLLFGAIAVVYPGLVFVKKEVMIEGDFEDHRDTIVNQFESLGYVKTAEDEDKLTFRIRSKYTRFMRAYEDAVTITKGTAPLILSGNRKDILRLESHITYALRDDIGEGAAQKYDDPYDFGGGNSGQNASLGQQDDNGDASGPDSGEHQKTE